MFRCFSVLTVKEENLILVFPPELDSRISQLNREHRDQLNSLEQWKSQEREHQEQINDDAKDLEKMSNKQSLLVKKVCTTVVGSVKSIKIVDFHAGVSGIFVLRKAVTNKLCDSKWCLCQSCLDYSEIIFVSIYLVW